MKGEALGLGAIKGHGEDTWRGWGNVRTPWSPYSALEEAAPSLQVPPHPVPGGPYSLSLVILREPLPSFRASLHCSLLLS